MITARLEDIKKRIAPYNTTLIAVSKKQPDDRIEAALKAGIRIFGENRVQQAQERWGIRRTQYPDLQLHLIGPLQSNKVKDACALFDCIHTVDRGKIAREIVKHAPDMPCLIQVNTGEETQKSGIMPQNLYDFYKFCTHELGMNIIGLMCIPLVNEPAGLHFGLLSDMAEKLNLSHLSMGMSDDYELALQYGATHIRIGSKLFGERHYG